jgi:hypothetical protein
MSDNEPLWTDDIDRQFYFWLGRDAREVAIEYHWSRAHTWPPRRLDEIYKVGAFDI